MLTNHAATPSDFRGLSSVSFPTLGTRPQKLTSFFYRVAGLFWCDLQMTLEEQSVDTRWPAAAGVPVLPRQRTVSDGIARLTWRLLLFQRID